MNEIKLENNQLATQIVERIANAEKILQEVKKVQDDYKAQLTQLMGDHKIKDIENDLFKVTYIQETESPRLDTKKLREEHEEVYLQCLTKSTKKAYVKITLK